MEFERALFRVYDRSLESLRADQPCYAGSRIRPMCCCKAFEVMILTLIALSMLLLGTLHINYVGENVPMCLHSELKYQKELASNSWLEMDHPFNTTTPDFPILGKNTILQINVGSRGTKDKLLRRDELYNESTDLNGAGDGEFKKLYRFAENPPLLYLNEQFVKNHNIQLMNITIARDCLTKGSSFLSSAMSIVGYDTIMINQLFSLRAGGVLENTGTKEEWGWNGGFLPPKGGYSFGEALAFKLGVFSQTCFSFFFVATVTSLIVRMLISSGVVIMFPLFYLLQMLGFRDLDMHILTLSYPWLGLPVEVLRRMGKPTGPLVGAHVFRVVVLYSMYEACQLAWSLWFYDKPLPDGMQLEVFAIVMIWEYFSMIYLRSANAIYFLPKFTLLYFAGFHFYFYGNSYAFFGVALNIMYLLILHALLATITYFEVQAAERLEVTFENPRAYFVELPWQSWQASLPPSWTLFMPLNARRRTIYDEAPNNAGATTGTNGGTPLHTGGGGGGGGRGNPRGRRGARGTEREDGGDEGGEDGGVEMQSMNPINQRSDSGEELFDEEMGRGAPPSSSHQSVNRVRPVDVLAVMDGDEDDEPELSTAMRRTRRSRRDRPTQANESTPASGLEERPLIH